MNAPSLRLHDRQPHAKLDLPGLNLPGLNTVRALAALGVVLLHACVPYLQHPMPGLQWSVQDTPSTLVDYLFWGIEVFIMPIFLVMAGFFAWQTLSRKGHAVLLKSRAKRLLLPLLFGMVVVLPIDLYIWIAGWIADGIVSPVKLKSLKFDGAIAENIWGLSHLWFLLYLFLYVSITAAAAWTINRSNQLARVSDGLASTHPWAIGFGLVALGAITLWFRPEVVWGFQHALAPVPSKWLYSGTFFAGGILLAVADPGLFRLQHRTRQLLPLAVLFLVAAVVLGRWHLGVLGTNELESIGNISESPQRRFAGGVLAIVTTVSAWLASLAVIGLAAKQAQRNSIWIQYLAAASFWVYLVHHPLLGLIHIDLKFAMPGLDPVLKMSLAFAISVGVSLLLYEAFIRRSKLGATLGFAWNHPRESTGEPTILPTHGDQRHRDQKHQDQKKSDEEEKIAA